MKMKKYRVELVKFNLWVRYPTVEAINYHEAKKIAKADYEGWGWEVKSLEEIKAQPLCMYIHTYVYTYILTYIDPYINT